MDNSLIFKTLNDNYYIYDNITRMIIPLETNVIKNLDFKDIKYNRVELKEDVIERINGYRKFKEHNNLNSKEEIKSRINFLKNIGYKQLTLMITEQCNLRCNYCIYSDKYNKTRTHNNNKMNWEIAKKAIDFYFKLNLESVRSNPNLTPCIGFYGGEPLLNWNILETCCEYIKSEYSSSFKDCLFTITTNGILLTEEKINYLLENKFNINISFDGNKIDHDRNRVDLKKNGSFNKVLDKLLLIDRMYENKLFSGSNKEILPYSILITYDNQSNLMSTQKFFNSYPQLGKHVSRITKVNDTNTTYYDEQKQSSKINSYIIKLITDYVKGKEDRSKISEVLFKQFTGNIRMNTNYVDIFSFGTCIPGEKLAVTPNGTLYMCEKIDYQSSIGNIFKGIDYWAQTENLDYFIQETNTRCTSCKISNLCYNCFASCADGEGGYLLGDKCDVLLKNTEKSLSLYYTALENRVLNLEYN